jgi:hypothetical protein
MAISLVFLKITETDPQQAEVEKVDRCSGPHVPPSHRSNQTSVPVIGRQLVDGVLAQAVLFTTVATAGSCQSLGQTVCQEPCGFCQEDLRRSASAVGELFSLQAAVLAYRADAWEQVGLKEKGMLLLYFTL